MRSLWLSLRTIGIGTRKFEGRPSLFLRVAIATSPQLILRAPLSALPPGAELKGETKRWSQLATGRRERSRSRKATWEHSHAAADTSSISHSDSFVQHPGKTKEKGENTATMGGLRNPQMALASSPGLRMVGAKIANILESLYKNEKVAASANSLVDGLGSEANAFLDQSVLQLVLKIFLRKFDAKQDANIGKHSHADVRSSYCDALWERILQEASDPEVSLPIWVREGTPAGIHMRIACHGVFPAANGPSKQVEASRAHSKANVEFESAKHVNYRSLYDTVDGEVLSKSEIERLLQQGFLEQFDSWQQVLDQWPDAVASRVACIAKCRADLTFKLRLMLDLLRSGVNGDCHVPEKVILPRLEDYVSSILDVFEQALAEG